MDNSANSYLHSSRLVQQLTRLNVATVRVPEDQFSESFGQLFELSGTVVLSDVLGTLTTQEFNSTGAAMAAVKDMFLEERAGLVRFIAKSFVPGRVPARGKLPTAEVFHDHCKFSGVYGGSHSDTAQNHDAAYQPFREFYVAYQGKLSAKIYHLRAQVADAVAGITPELDQLISLDKGLGQALSARSRKLFDGVPKLLGRRFRILLDEHWQELPDNPEAGDLKPWMASGGWIWGFCQQMREMLLAELEVRLLPVLGLIETHCDTANGEGSPNEGE